MHFKNKSKLFVFFCFQNPIKAHAVQNMMKTFQNDYIQGNEHGKPDTTGPTVNYSLSVEEFVKLVVKIVKENSLHPIKSVDIESPEEILKRKRLQVSKSTLHSVCHLQQLA